MTGDGHELTFDSTQDMSLVEGLTPQPAKAAQMAATVIDAVCRPDAVLVLATGHEGGVIVELGAALALSTASRYAASQQ